MHTEIVKIDNENIDTKKMEHLGKIIRDGGVVAFPTETVYGLGADALNSDAVKKIFIAKGRPADNPLIVHFARIEDISEVAHITDDAKKILEKFSPGPLTVILKKKECLGDTVTAGLDTVAVRIPENETARALILASKRPIAAPSANLSGKPSPTTAKDVMDDMTGRVDAIIDGVSCKVGVESTVLDMTGEAPVILRPGAVTLDDIKSLFPDATVDKHVLQAVSVNDKPKSPGMKYKHYAPDAEVFVVEGEREKIKQKINELICENKGKRIGVLTMGTSYPADVLINAGRDNREYAKNLFASLREFDRQGAEIVFAEFVSDDGYGLAVKNRLYKAAGNKIIYV